MKLKEFTSMPLEEALEGMDLIDFRTYTNDDGEVIVVELKYKNPKHDGKKAPVYRGGVEV